MIVAENPDGMLYNVYPDVWVKSIPEMVDAEALTADLNQLGEETNSPIGLRIAQPASETGATSQFTYVLFGEGTLPNGFNGKR